MSYIYVFIYIDIYILIRYIYIPYGHAACTSPCYMSHLFIFVVFCSRNLLCHLIYSAFSVQCFFTLVSKFTAGTVLTFFLSVLLNYYYFFCLLSLLGWILYVEQCSSSKKSCSFLFKLSPFLRVCFIITGTSTIIYCVQFFLKKGLVADK